MDDPQPSLTRFVGVTLDEVRASGSGLYEVTTTTGVPVRLHDMSLTRLVHDATARTVTIEFLYDDATWTPPEAQATPLAVFRFEGVELLERQDEAAEPDTSPDVLGQVAWFNYEEPSGVFHLSTYTTDLVFSASVASVMLQAARPA